MRWFVVGVVVGLVPYLGVRLDRRTSWVAATRDSRIGQWVNNHVIWPYWYNPTRRFSRWRYARYEKIGAWWVSQPAVMAVLGHRSWRITYVEWCIYGGPPDHPAPRVLATTWHWTKLGAEFHRRYRFHYATFGSFRLTTCIDKHPKGPVDPATMQIVEA